MMKSSVLVKPTHIFLAVLTLAIGMACSKDKDKEPAVSDGIVGTWELTSVSYDGDWIAFDEAMEVTMVGRDINNVRITFNSDGTVTGNGGSFTWVITSKADPSEVLELPTQLFVDGGTWEHSGNTLSVTDLLSENPQGIPIVTLDATTLHLSGSTVIDEELGASGTIDLQFTRRN